MEAKITWAIVRRFLPYIAILALVATAFVLREQRNGARADRQSLIAAVTSEAVTPDKRGRKVPLSVPAAVEAVHSLARSKTALEAAVERQNAAIDRNAAVSTAARAAAHDAATSVDASLDQLQRELKAVKPGKDCPTTVTADQWGKL